MLLVEDVLDIIASHDSGFGRGLDHCFGGLLAGDWYASFVRNVHQHTEAGRPLSTEQSRIVLKIAGRVRSFLVEAGDVTAGDIDGLLASPLHRQPLYQSTSIPREVRHLGANLLGFRFKFNEVIRKDLCALAAEIDGTAPRFNAEHKLWIVPVTRKALRHLRPLIAKHRFETDATCEEYLTLCARSLGQSSMLAVDDESGLIVGSICDNEMLCHWMTHVAGAEHV